jgi:regulator of protease activity HflC (stomatin/prohibitin superfamily)
MLKRIKVKELERAFLFRENTFVAVLGPGVHWYLDPLYKLRVRIHSVRVPWITDPELDVIVKSGKLGNEAIVVDLKDTQRALVWIDGRFDRVIGPGIWALWKNYFDVRVEVVSATELQLIREDLQVILKSPLAALLLETHVVEPQHVAVVYRDGAYWKTLPAGTYAFWKEVAKVRVLHVDMREQTIDVSGQEIMTADKVTLRLNALVSYRVTEPLKFVAEADDARQALYRAMQLALREAIGTRELDALLAGKEAIARELEQTLAARANELGTKIVAVGIRDIVLPGEMKELMNRVTEAKKAAEASLITRREETAAMRMQANTAKLLEATPVLMKMRELEVLEKVADKANLTVVLGEGSLADRVVKMI